MSPHVPAGERDGHAVERHDAAEPHGQLVDLDHAVGSAASTLGTAAGAATGSACDLPLPDPESFLPRSEVVRHLLGDAAGRSEEHLQHADAEQDGEQLDADAPPLEERRQQLEHEPADDRAAEVVHAAHEHDGVELDRVLDRELVDVDTAARRGEQPPATPAMNDASAKAHSL